MGSGGFKLFIVEGEAREIRYFDNLRSVFFRDKKTFFVTLPAGENIYMLWNDLNRDDFQTDVLEVLREKAPGAVGGLDGIKRSQVDEIFLFFDCDPHTTNLPGGVGIDDVLPKMLETFSNETELGKLYVSYPMVEAVRDWVGGSCNVQTECVLDMDTARVYKRASSEGNPNVDVMRCDEPVWREEIENFAMCAGCLCDLDAVPEFDYYRNEMTPSDVYGRQRRYLDIGEVFVLSAVPEFLLDYFPKNFWRTMVRATRLRHGRCCRRTGP